MPRGRAGAGGFRTYSKTVNVSWTAGGTIGTPGPTGEIKLNDKGHHLVEAKATVSQSIQTTVETSQAMVRLKGDSLPADVDLLCRGVKGASDPGTNITPGALPAEKFPLDIPVSPDEIITISVAEMLGVGTGAIMATVELVYANMRPGQAWLDRHAAQCGFNGSIRWAGAGVAVAAAATARTALTTINIPQFVSVIQDVLISHAVEGAETASQESYGNVEIDYGFSDAGVQEHALGMTRHPELGAAVDKAHDCQCATSTVNVDITKAGTLTAKPYINLGAAVTGGRAAIGLFGF